MRKYTLLITLLIGISHLTHSQEDKYLWLEEVDSKEALEFVNAQSARTLKLFSNEKDYQAIYDDCLKIYNSDDRIPYPTIYGDYVYNFWKDKDHVRGIWRRCLMSNYNKGTFNWETLLDIDELSKKDDIKWVYKGASGLYPDYNRFLIELSNGGADAVTTREFDVNEKKFVDKGFFIDEAKGFASYVDPNTLIVAYDFGEGTTTTSGYPTQVKLWQRGSALNDAELIFEGESSDVGTWGGTLRDGDKIYVWVGRATTFYTYKTFIWYNNEMTALDVPEDASWGGILNNQMILQLKSDWTVQSKTYKSGSILSVNFTELLKGNKNIQLIIEPDELSSIAGISTTKNKLLINLLTNVKSHLYIYSFENEKWSMQKVNAPDVGTISIITTDEQSDDYFFTFENYITPTTIYGANANNNSTKIYKSLPAFFDATKYKVNQYKAVSKDGTEIPYFLVAAKDFIRDGTNPTLISAYGGFESSSTPYYSRYIWRIMAG